MQTSIIGIDPGEIHTGCVAFLFNEAERKLDVDFAVINGVDVHEVRAWIEDLTRPAAIFIEDYNPGNFGRVSKRMSEALGRLKAEFPPRPDDAPPHFIVKYVDNAGINTLVPVAVQKSFGVAKFPVATHHNDLVSAGKIAILGMMQDKSQHSLRLLASRVVADELRGHPWTGTLNA